MSDGNSRDQAESPKRRAILNTVAAGIASTGITAIAGAQSSSDSLPELPEVTELHGGRREFLIGVAMRISDVGRLLEDAFEIDADRASTEDAQAFRLKHPNKTIRFVKIPLPDVLPQQVANDVKSEATLSVDEEDLSIKQNSEAHIGVYFDGFDTGASAAVVANDNEGGIYHSVIRPDSDGMVSTTNILQRQNECIEIRAVGNQDPDSEIMGDRVQPQGGSKCEICKILVDFICEHGCGLGGIGICLAAGIITTPVGGGACSVVAYFLCNEYDGDFCDANTPERACSKYCDGMPPLEN